MGICTSKNVAAPAVANIYIITTTVFLLILILAAVRVQQSSVLLLVGEPQSQPVKIFLLAGDDPCEGHASLNQLQRLTGNGNNNNNNNNNSSSSSSYYKHLVNREGEWLVRDDVYVVSQQHDQRQQQQGQRDQQHDSNNSRRQQRGGNKKLSTEKLFGREKTTAQTTRFFGPELEMGNVLGDGLRGGPVVIVKAACKANRSLHKHFRAPSAGKSTGIQYLKMMASLKRSIRNLHNVLEGNALAAYKNAGYTIEGMVWWHGQSDINDVQGRSEYSSNLNDLLQDIRTEIGSEDFPIVIGELAGAAGVRGTTATAASTTTTKDEEMSFRAMQASVVTHSPQRKWTRYVPTSMFFDDDDQDDRDDDNADNANNNKNKNKNKKKTRHNNNNNADAMIRIGGAFATELLDMMSYRTEQGARWAFCSDHNNNHQYYYQDLVVTPLSTALVTAAALLTCTTMIAFWINRAKEKKRRRNKSQQDLVSAAVSEDTGDDVDAGDDDEWDRNPPKSIPSIISTDDEHDSSDSFASTSDTGGDGDEEEDCGDCFCCEGVVGINGNSNTNNPYCGDDNLPSFYAVYDCDYRYHEDDEVEQDDDKAIAAVSDFSESLLEIEARSNETLEVSCLEGAS